MISPSSWETQFKLEIANALLSRNSGNEGKARVCARRAAGLVVREYLLRNGFENSDPSVVVNLNFLLQQAEIPPQIQDIISHFLVRITPDGNLPIDADLIEEAQWLAKELLHNT
jgi:hypothetical protein